ncbi:AMP-binding protein [Pseudonocardia sp. 73-21]|uniref:AMP-binding protein n=1 Tax=Pseudonocardia sp. 73-21 TaxID=1895809 RepID=UPI00342E0554
MSGQGRRPLRLGRDLVRRAGPRSTAVANTLLGWGVRSGDAVAVLMENRPEMLDSWFGVAMTGGLYVSGPGRSGAQAATAPA